MVRYTNVHCVCGGSEPEYTSGRKDFILGPRLEGGGETTASFQFSSRGEQKTFIAACGNRCFFSIRFQFHGPLWW